MKKCFNMLHIIFKYAKGEAIIYLNIDTLLSIVSALQLLILQLIIDGFAQNENKFFAGGIGIALLCCYFFAMNILENFKVQMAFRLEKSISIILGTEIVETINSLDYDCYENEKMYDVIEKVSDKPYQHFVKAFFSFSNLLGILIQLTAIFVYLTYISGIGVGVSICLIAAIFFFDYKIMITSDELENDKIPEERMLKYYINLFFDKKYLYEIKILQTEAFFMNRISQYMKKVYRKRLKISFCTQKYYGYSCLFLSLWAIWALGMVGWKVYNNIVPVGVFLASIKMIDMVSDLSGLFSEEYVGCGEELQKIAYYENLKRVGVIDGK